MTLRILYLFLLCLLQFAPLHGEEAERDYSNFRVDRFQETKLATAKAEEYFSGAANHFLRERDSANYLVAVSYLADINYRRGRYNKAFDMVYDALPIAERSGDPLPMMELNQLLVSLYKVYDKDSTVLDFALRNVEIAKEYAAGDDPQRIDRRVSCYLAVANQALTMQNLDMAQSYLDSCYLSSTTEDRLYYVDTFYAKLLNKRGENRAALNRLSGVIPYMISSGGGFQITVFKLYGEIYESMSRPDSAAHYYTRAIAAIDSLESSLVDKPILLERVARISAVRGDYRGAYRAMEGSKILSDSLFAVQSRQNNKLFDIKNHYREQVEREKATITRQSEMLESSRRFRVVLIGLIIFITIAAVVVVVCIRLRVKIREISLAKARSEEQSRSEIDLKNRELTANALQFVEREQMLNDLLERVGSESPQLREEIEKRLQGNSHKIWEEFNIRFTQTNRQFYEALRARHPDLTQSDLKLCALLRLNFDSKEMSQLMGISLSSVHTSRSRLRKRLGLGREVNLGSYLNTL